MKDKKIYTYQISLFISESPIHSSSDFVNGSAICPARISRERVHGARFKWLAGVTHSNISCNLSSNFAVTDVALEVFWRK